MSDAYGSSSATSAPTAAGTAEPAPTQTITSFADDQQQEQIPKL